MIIKKIDKMSGKTVNYKYTHKIKAGRIMYWSLNSSISIFDWSWIIWCGID